MSTKLAIITDGHEGRGYDIVESLCKTKRFDGDVYLTSPNVSSGMGTVERLNAQGLAVKFHLLDLKSETSITELKNFVVGNYNGIDLLVNNTATLFNFRFNPSSFDDAFVDTALANYRALRNVCDALFPLLRPGARVVNVSPGFYYGPPTVILEYVENLKVKFSSPALTVDGLDALFRQVVDRRTAADYRRDFTEFGWAYASYKLAVSALSNVQQRQFETDAGRRDIVVDTLHPGYNYVQMNKPTSGMSVHAYALGLLRREERLESHLYGLRGAVAGRQGWQLPWFY